MKFSTNRDVLFFILFSSGNSIDSISSFNKAKKERKKKVVKVHHFQEEDDFTSVQSSLLIEIFMTWKTIRITSNRRIREVYFLMNSYITPTRGGESESTKKEKMIWRYYIFYFSDTLGFLKILLWISEKKNAKVIFFFFVLETIPLF